MARSRPASCSSRSAAEAHARRDERRAHGARAARLVAPEGLARPALAKLRLSEGGRVVGRVDLRPGIAKLAAGGAIKLAAGSKLGHRGQAVTADLALKLDRSLAH